MVNLALSQAALRFPRRYPLSLLVILIPIALLLYYNFGVLSTWSPMHIVPLPENGAPEVGKSTPSISPATNGTNILLVSSFYPLSKSKHSMSQYTAWLTLFLARISTDIYFYTTPELESTIRKIRGQLPITIDTTFSSPFEIPPLQGKEDQYKKMHEWDRERNIHSPDLYAVWAAKPYFLAQATRNTENKYDYAFWVDAGSFREQHTYTKWPDPSRVNEIFTEGRKESGQREENLILFSIQRLPDVSMLLWKDNMGPIDNDFSEGMTFKLIIPGIFAHDTQSGSFFGGSLKIVTWWERLYFAYHDYYLKQSVFVGKDQSLINSLFLLQPDHVIVVWHGDPDAPSTLYKPKSVSSDDTSGLLGDCGNAWYYYQFFVAGERDRATMQSVWDRRWHWDFWHAEWWTRKRETCRVTRVLAMEWLLRKPFGEMWRPPPTTVSW